MKKFLSFFLVLTLVFPLCACNGSKAEKYCSECGKGIAKSVAFCEHCGAAVKENNENKNNSNNSSSTQSQKQETSEAKPVVASKPTTSQTTSSKPAPVHTHSYSKKVTAATCTQKGYTTYTCSCGHSYKDNYTNPAHSYSNYKCTKCAIIDKSHAYEYLILWVKQNGKTNGTNVEYDIRYDALTFSLVYSAQYDCLLIEQYGYVDNEFFFSLMDFEEYYYSVSYGETELSGYIKPEQFTSTSPISYESYEGPSDLKYDFIEISRIALDDLIFNLKETLEEEKIGISLSDLGFKAYK